MRIPDPLRQSLRDWKLVVAEKILLERYMSEAEHAIFGKIKVLLKLLDDADKSGQIETLQSVIRGFYNVHLNLKDEGVKGLKGNISLGQLHHIFTVLDKKENEYDDATKKIYNKFKEENGGSVDSTFELSEPSRDLISRIKNTIDKPIINRLTDLFKADPNNFVAFMKGLDVPLQYNSNILFLTEPQIRNHFISKGKQIDQKGLCYFIGQFVSSHLNEKEKTEFLRDNISLIKNRGLQTAIAKYIMEIYHEISKSTHKAVWNKFKA